MKPESINPSLLNFLAGVTATVAITMALNQGLGTTTGVGQYAAWHPYVIALPWGLSAIFWTMAASTLQDALHEADFVITPLLTRTEKQDIYRSSIDTVRKISRIYILAAAIFVILGFAIQWLPL